MNITISPFGDLTIEGVNPADLSEVYTFYEKVRSLSTQALIEYEASTLANDFPNTQQGDEEECE